MNTPIITCANRCIKSAVVFVLLAASVARADWSIDFSRRNIKTRENDLNAPLKPSASMSSRAPASVGGGPQESQVVDPTVSEPPKKGVLDTIFDSGEPIQDVVIILTDKGFVPSTVRVRKGGRYKVHVVNVNEKEKNVSFMLDGFSEHHATYYGKIKVFVLEPKKEGTYSFQSPETSSEGKLIVFGAPTTNVRVPASEE